MNEHPAQDDRLAEAVAAACRMAVPSPPPAELVLNRLRQSETVTIRSIPRVLYNRIRRVNPVSRYGFVALALSALVLIGFGGRAQAILLADVVKAIAKHKTVRFEEEHETNVGREHHRTSTVVGTMDRVHFRMESSAGNLQIMDRAKGTTLQLDPQRKTALVVKFPRGKDQFGFLAVIEQLENDRATTSARERLDGLDVVVYRLEKEGVKSTIWVDTKTKLPVRMEMERLRVQAEKVGGMKQKTTMTHFVWDPPIENPDKFFSVEPPPGYEVKTKDLFKQ